MQFDELGEFSRFVTDVQARRELRSVFNNRIGSHAGLE